jgi:hypothetical protein
MPIRRPTQTELSQIALRRDERAFVVGGSGTGKSEAGERIARIFLAHYDSQRARRLILDTKPRFMAQWAANGMSARGRYKNWSHGQYVPDSIVVDDPRDLRRAFHDYRTVIMQSRPGETMKPRLTRLLAGAEWFLDDSRKNRPQLMQVDETMDFFNVSGSSRAGNDILERIARAGRERGTAALYCSQRTKSIPTPIMEEMQRLYCFRIDARGDVKRLTEMGAPSFAPPTEDYQFYYWYKRDYHNVWGPYQLDLK